jgi:hypothetical protein
VSTSIDLVGGEYDPVGDREMEQDLHAPTVLALKGNDFFKELNLG